MAEFLTTKGIASNIEKIIIEAEEEIIIISPYIKFSQDFINRIIEASENGVNVKIVYGKELLKQSQKKLLDSLNIDLYFLENLHAKCYYNEKSMIITSMNMYDYSEINNREMGILIDANEDYKIFEKAKKEALSIFKYATVEKIKYKMEKGHCIRCNDKINFNPQKPFCRDCFTEWNYWENYDYEENYCHCCGKKHNTTMKAPQCLNCFLENVSKLR